VAGKGAWLILFPVALTWAQAPSFEVASVKPQPWEGNGRVGVFVRGSTLTAEHVCLYGLVEFAYDLKDEHLSGGPSWAKCGVLASSDLYQVVAKAEGDSPPSKDQFRLMLQTLLAERFQLRVRHVPKDLPTYNLVKSPRGAKLQESAADAKFALNVDARVNRGKSVRITAVHVSITQLLGQFEGYAGRPLFDHTGLSGFYTFQIEFDHEADSGAADAPGTDAVGQTFASALEKQLGLKLEPGTASFDTVAIDHAQKPSAN
jgi:uncharacterized protein (TIGR03435 family)